MTKISEKKIKEIIKDLIEFKTLNNEKHKAQYYYNTKSTILKSDLPEKIIKEFLDAYSVAKQQTVETDDTAKTYYERDENGKIKFYHFEIYRKDTAPLKGKLSREEMETIYKLYSNYGAGLTQKIVSREFPQYTFIEFKRILRSWNIYKHSSEFPPHMVEEKSEEELLQLHNQNKENNVLRKIEKDQLAEANKLLNKFVAENKSLKEQLFSFKNIKVDIIPTPKPEVDVEECYNDQSIILHLSDLHIGSKCESTTLYPNPYDKDEIIRRLDAVVTNVAKFGVYNNIIINLLGDNLDGLDGMTARRDHIMPQCMDNAEQIKTLLEVMNRFIDQLRKYSIEPIKIYSVNCGNHDGWFGYAATLSLKHLIEQLYPEITFTLFDEFIGSYTFNEHTYVLCHGKDPKFCKKPMPLNLDEKTKIQIFEWLDYKGITGQQIHFVKGDLHSNNYNSCMKFDYRNVLSLYGHSDYSSYNYSRNSYGVSYDYYVGNLRTMGTFENI